MRKMDIFECQPGMFCRSTLDETQDGYRYMGRDKPSGLHLFQARNGKRELFAKRRSVAGWHLKRGMYVYEFCRSA